MRSVFVAALLALFADAGTAALAAVFLADGEVVLNAAPPVAAAALVRAAGVLTAAATAFARVDAAVAAPVAGTGFLLIGYSTT